MKKIYISQPMRYKTDEQIEDEREKAIEECTRLFGSVKILESFGYIGAPIGEDNLLWYLGENIKLLSEADVVYFCNEWEKYNGCTIEHECAVRYGKKCVYY